MSKKYVSVLKDSAATPGYRIIAPEDYVYTENGTKKVKKIDSKADKKVPATAGNLATLDSTGNLADSGKQTTDFMNALTTEYDASGSVTKTVTKVTQAKTGAVTVTYSDIQSGTTSQKGLVQLENSTSSTSTTKAATPNSVKSAYDLASGKYSKPSDGIPSSDMDSAVQASLGKADTAIQGVKLNGSTLTPSSAKVVDLGNLKIKQTAVSDPSASGTTITAIATISQDANGVITATKKTIQSASQSQDGVMSAADKKKLDGIATGAEVNQNAFSNVKVGDVTVAADAKTDTLTLVAGSNVTITPDATADKITIAAKDTTYTADAGIKLDGTVFKHTNSVSGGTVGPTTDTAGDTLSVPYVTYDSQGHVTASGTRTHSVGTASTSGAGIVQLQDSIDSTTTKAATPNAVKNFVNSSIATNTAYFLGTYDVVTDLGLTTSATNAQIATALNSYTFPSGVTVSNNDYVFVSINMPATTDVDEYRRFKYADGTPSGSWSYEYTLNNSSFTNEQWAAINSDVTDTKVAAYDAHLTNTNNPHNVTKTQVGLSDVVNTGDSDTPVSGGTTKFTTGGAYTELNKKADKVTGATEDNFVSFDVTGNIKDSGTSASSFKTKQVAVIDPTASGNALSFIDSISQDANGEISVTKKTVTVDSTYSASGTNPVNGQAIADALDSLDSYTQVTQTADSSNTGNYPILAKNTTGTSTITDTSRFNANISLTPSTGTMNATAFNVATHCKMEYNSTDRSLDFNFS